MEGMTTKKLLSNYTHAYIYIYVCSDSVELSYAIVPHQRFLLVENEIE